MNRYEGAVIEKSIRELMADDGDLHRAISDLCQLIGWKYPKGKHSDKKKEEELSSD